MSRIEMIRQRLTDKLKPTSLDVIDESYKHVGHPGAASGAGHFAISIESELFANKSSIERHRMVYAALGDLMPHEIHALRIDAKS